MQAHLHFFDSVASTQKLAREMALAGEPEGTTILARQQTSGKGRRERDWASPVGGLYMSVLLRPGRTPRQLSWIPLMAGISVLEALQTWQRPSLPEPKLKWPNDVLLHGKKVGGILGELEQFGKEVFCLLGIGLNLSAPLESLPERPLFPATSVQTEWGLELQPEAVAKKVVERLSVWYEPWRGGESSALRRRFQELSLHSGQWLRILSGAKVLEGRDVGLSPQGGLLLEVESGAVEEILSGTVLGMEARENP